MSNVLDVVQIVLSVLLIIAILMQSRGAGLGETFGGGGEVFQTKRGVEKTLFRATIVLSVLFLGTALLNVIY